MNLLKTYYEFVLDNTESPIAFHRWSMITVVGALLARNISYRNGHSVYYPTMYTNLIGDAGTRKTSAMNIPVRLAKLAGYTSVAKGKTSKEKFLEDLSKGFNHVKGAKKETIELDELLNDMDITVHHECIIAAEEFTNFIGVHNFEFAAMLGELWDYVGPYEHRIRNGKSIIVDDPIISIISGNTPTGLAQAFPPEMTGQGFMSRLLLIYSDKSGRSFPFPKDPDPLLEQELVNHLFFIRNSVRGEVELEPEAKTYLAHVYQNYPAMDDYRFRAYHNRRFTHLLKLCMVIAAMEGRLKVTERDALYCNTMLAQAELFMPKALSEFGNTRYAAVSGRVIQLLHDNLLTPLTIADIYKQVRQEVDGMVELSQVLRNLADADVIQEKDGKFLPCILGAEKVENFVDWNLLEEYNGIS